ncbi:MAG: DEAD/DEAH box helicase family protein [Myxococcales bacterium]|nr:DEAD/DEAH box helicase family protein [Myxococcales bacterium]
MAIHLRPYQQAAVAAVHEHVAHGRRRVLLVAATGSGKTACAVHLMQAAAAVGQRCLFVAHRRELINQTYRKLVEDGADPSQLGVIMASDPRRNPGAMVQVASVDTLRFRNKPRADWLFFDEAHRALSPSSRTSPPNTRTPSTSALRPRPTAPTARGSASCTTSLSSSPRRRSSCARASSSSHVCSPCPRTRSPTFPR